MTTPDLLDIASLLSAEERARLDRLKEALAGLDRAELRGCWERAEFPHHLVPVLAEAGSLGLHLDEYGTQPRASWLFRGLAAMELGRVDASIATFCGVSSSLFGLSVRHFGSEEQRRRYLPRIVTGEESGAFGLTEPLHGSDVAGAMTTTVRREGEDWVINGHKRWIGNATWCDHVVVWAREETTIAADFEDDAGRSGSGRPRTLGFIVPTSSEGFEALKIEGKYSLRTVQNADFTLTEVRIPESGRLPGVESFKQTSEVLKYTRLEVAWVSVGNALGALDGALDHARNREQFGKPLAKFQLIQDLLVRAQAEIATALASLAHAAALAERGELTDEQASFMKLVASGNARRAVAACREVLGGDGITLEKDVIKHFMDAEALYTFEGTHQVNTLIVGRALTGMSAFV
ncbi:acyl-CoA dehydrogenase family protein [Citricoccus sp. NPDC055426]|uniref:acyl-CoA dehydrogenase family protein n=1 Tax=Citricoccus sp. NPDC055426 TaxID=3155536 RepID=UPI0034327138